jgi:voltage-gated potassium channel
MRRPASGSATQRPSLRRQVHELLEPQDAASHPLAAALHGVLIALIILNVIAVVAESVPALAGAHPRLFLAIELVSLSVFTVEYGLRLWSAPEDVRLRHLPPWRARIRWAMSPGALVDLAAVAPFYLVAFVGADFRSLLVLRLLRFFKLARYSPGLASLFDALRAEKRALLACAVILAGTVLIAATLMHWAEHDAQPDKLGTIPDAMYWAVITLTTVGYGDISPVTGLGRVIASLTAVVGLVMLALPVGIIASAFAREINRRDFLITWNQVAKVPLFAELDALEVADIMRCLGAESFEPGEIVTRRGEEANSMYFICSGEVQIELPGDDIVLGPGQFFGELAVLAHARRSATVRAATRARLLSLEAADLHRLMDRHPGMARRVREVAQARIERTRVGEYGDLSEQEVEAGRTRRAG